MQPASKLNVNFFLTEEELNCVRESTNSEDPYGVAVMRRSACRPFSLWHARLGRIPRKISAACALFLKRKGTIRCTVTASQHFSTVLPQGGLVVNVDIPRSIERLHHDYYW